jgi:hypothetical protein
MLENVHVDDDSVRGSGPSLNTIKHQIVGTIIEALQ